jgi:hypothetical protein
MAGMSSRGLVECRKRVCEEICVEEGGARVECMSWDEGDGGAHCFAFSAYEFQDEGLLLGEEAKLEVIEEDEVGLVAVEGVCVSTVASLEKGLGCIVEAVCRCCAMMGLLLLDLKSKDEGLSCLVAGVLVEREIEGQEVEGEEGDAIGVVKGLRSEIARKQATDSISEVLYALFGVVHALVDCGALEEPLEPGSDI